MKNKIEKRFVKLLFLVCYLRAKKVVLPSQSEKTAKFSGFISFCSLILKLGTFDISYHCHFESTLNF